VEVWTYGVRKKQKKKEEEARTLRKKEVGLRPKSETQTASYFQWDEFVVVAELWEICVPL